jgi:hypothetical protein
MNTRAEKTTRETEVRETDTRARQWRPADQLPMPQEVPGWKFRWLRMSTLGEVDVRSMSAARREGWEMVTPKDMPDLAAECDSHRDDMIEFGGLVLVKIPVELWKQMQDYYQQKSDSQVDGINNSLFSQEDKRMPLYREHSSVTNGRLR